MTALTEFVDIAAPVEWAGNKIRIEAQFDQFHLDIGRLYGGDPIELPETAPNFGKTWRLAPIISIGYPAISFALQPQKVHRFAPLVT